MSKFGPRPPSIWRWVGDALLLGDIPADGRSECRMVILRNVLELDFEARDADVRAELARFRSHGHRRGA